MFNLLLGYCPDERCMFLLHGNGKNGKSILVEIIAKLAGDYAMRTPTQTLMEKRYDGIPNDVARLQGAPLVYVAD